MLIWLGESDDDSDLAMEMVVSYPGGHADEEAWAALDRLARRSWWKRLWCLQEVASSRTDSMVICGTKSVPWTRMNDVCRYLPHHWERTGKSPHELHMGGSTDLGFQKLNGIRSDNRRGEPLRLLHLLSATLVFDTSDPRDKVLALVGLSHLGQVVQVPCGRMASIVPRIKSL